MQYQCVHSYIARSVATLRRNARQVLYASNLCHVVSALEARHRLIVNENCRRPRAAVVVDDVVGDDGALSGSDVK